MHIVVEFRDRALSDYAKRLEQMGSKMGVLAQALNEGGRALRQATVAAETAQTGLPGGTLERAQHEIPAGGSLTYTIWSEGGNVRLKYFHPAEGGGGVTAYPWNAAHYYRGAFITSGLPGRRAPSPKLNGHVYRNVGGGRWGGPIQQVRSGLFIPTEMTKGQTASTFQSYSAIVLDTVVRRLGSLLP